MNIRQVPNKQLKRIQQVGATSERHNYGKCDTRRHRPPYTSRLVICGYSLNIIILVIIYDNTLNFATANLSYL